MVARIARVEAVPCDSAHEAAWLERNLLERRLPPWNRSPGGQEAEVWIRLSASPRRPGLTVVRQPAPGDFGPYLGGQKVRDAVSGLSRVLPLGHAADHQAGTGRELARVRGASPGARAGLARGIAAVLDRDQAAVAALRAELTARRDAAATALAFEFAAKLQAELEAVDWITAEQKVTRARRVTDADVYGWAAACSSASRSAAAGCRGWRQRPCAGCRRPPLPRAVPARLGRLRPAAVPNWRLAALGAANSRPGSGLPSRNLRWVKLNQLPESSRMTASIP